MRLRESGSLQRLEIKLQKETNVKEAIVVKARVVVGVVPSARLPFPREVSSFDGYVIQQ